MEEEEEQQQAGEIGERRMKKGIHEWKDNTLHDKLLLTVIQDNNWEIKILAVWIKITNINYINNLF